MTCHGGPLPGHWERRTASNQRLLCSSLSSPLSTEELLSLRSSLSATSPRASQLIWHSIRLPGPQPWGSIVSSQITRCALKRKQCPFTWIRVCVQAGIQLAHTQHAHKDIQDAHKHTQPSNAGSPRTREKDDPKMYARTCHSMLTLTPASTLVYMGEQSVFTMTCSYCAQILKVGRP